jgi:triosephosphate isomerase
MATRKTLIVGNWKMHLTVSESSLLVHRLDKLIADLPPKVEVVVCPSYLALQPLALSLDRKKFRLGAQNLYQQDEGAFTGEVSAAMLRDIVDYAIIGHSERRQHFHEKDEIALKVSAALRNRITPILCVGETLLERQQGETDRVLHDQLSSDLTMLTAEDLHDFVIAYEPVWAIGSGDFARSEQVEQAVATIRRNVEHMHDRTAARAVRVLYGGSVTPDLSLAYLRAKGVDGLLVGGASLNYQQFASIVERAKENARG